MSWWSPRSVPSFRLQKELSKEPISFCSYPPKEIQKYMWGLDHWDEGRQSKEIGKQSHSSLSRYSVPWLGNQGIGGAEDEDRLSLSSQWRRQWFLFSGDRWSSNEGIPWLRFELFHLSPRDWMKDSTQRDVGNISPEMWRSLRREKSWKKDPRIGVGTIFEISKLRWDFYL